MIENIIIMAGGAGKRLWPASMGKTPKQFLKIDGEKSLFLNTLERAFNLGITGMVYIVTHEDHVEAALKECSILKEDMRKRIVILAEPVARNTAPALALAAARMVLDNRSPETALVMAADHLIEPQDSFMESVINAYEEASGGYIVTFGIKPSRPSTGYGYIEAGNCDGIGCSVLSFREKPDLATAEKYVESGRYFWNSGLFAYRTDVFLSQLNEYSKEIYNLFSSPDEKMFRLKKTNSVKVYYPSRSLREVYSDCPSISVDYAIMEKTSDIRMVKASFDWNDVGSWDVIADLNGGSMEKVLEIQSANNFVYSEIPVALCGVENLIVVVANNRVLICSRGNSQLVKEAAEKDSK